MNIYVQKVLPYEWQNISAITHKVSFGQERSPEMDRIDYALVAFNDEKEPVGYCTIIEIDKNSIYMQHGGAFPNIAKSVWTVKTYFMFLNWLKDDYKSITTRTWNENLPMLKLAMSAGLRINGTHFDDGELFVNLIWKKKAA